MHNSVDLPEYVSVGGFLINQRTNKWILSRVFMLAQKKMVRITKRLKIGSVFPPFFIAECCVIHTHKFSYTLQILLVVVVVVRLRATDKCLHTDLILFFF